MSEDKQAVEQEGVAGELAPVEIGQLQQLQAQANSCYNQIGQLEVRKAAVLERLAALEIKGREVMDGIAERCNIDKGVPWRITPDNKVQVVSNVTPFPGGDAAE